MSYIGRGTENISNVEVLDNLTFNGSASYTLQKSSTNFVPSSANNLLISISGVVQQGNFSVSGSTITFDTTVSASDTCDWILHYGTGLITTVADGAITEAKLGSNAVTTAKINNGAITSAKLDSGLALGKIGQVVSTRIGSSSWQLTTTQNTWLNYDDGTVDLELDITPSATSSKILLMVDARIYVYRATAGHHAGISTRFLHNETTAIHAQSTDGDGGWYTYDNANTYYTQNVSTTYLHSPASTSSQNYIFQMYFTGAQQFRYGRNYSTITAMEVLA